MASPQKNAPVYGIDLEFNVAPNHVHLWFGTCYLNMPKPNCFQRFVGVYKSLFSSCWDNNFKHGHCKDFFH